MNRPIPVLTALLAVQILLAALLFAGSEDIGTYASDEQLIGLTLTEIDGVRIEQSDRDPLEVKKQGGGWMLPGHHGFPAAKDKVEGMVEDLLALNKSWPVATTAESAKHFQVDNETFERKITFVKDDKVLKTLILGTAPGFKKVHARIDGADEIYAIAFSAHRATPKADDWTDKQYLKLEAADIERAELPELTLTRNDGTLHLEGLAENQETDRDQAEELVRRLAGLSFLSVLGTEEKPEYRLDSPAFSYVLKPKSGDAVTYTFGQPEGDEDFVLKTSAHPYYFRVSRYTLERIRELKREELAKEKGKETEESESQEATEAVQNEPETP